MTGCYQAGSPVTGLRKSLARSSSPTPRFLKSNMLFRLPEIESKLPEMAGSPQLPSMNLVIEAWLVSVWSTKLDFAQGEMTSSGSRGPRPQRPCSPASAVPAPHAPAPVRVSPTPLDGLVTPE